MFDHILSQNLCMQPHATFRLTIIHKSQFIVVGDTPTYPSCRHVSFLSATLVRLNDFD